MAQAAQPEVHYIAPYKIVQVVSWTTDSKIVLDDRGRVWERIWWRPQHPHDAPANWRWREIELPPLPAGAR